MPFDVDFRDRYSAQYVLNLTNPDDEVAVVFDPTRLARAVTDVEADFLTYAGVAADDTDPQHVEVAMDGIEAKLLKRTAQTEIGDSKESDFRDALKAMSKTGARNRILPSRSRRTRGGIPVENKWTEDQIDDLVPDNPTGSNVLPPN